MRLRSQALALAALVFLSFEASAQSSRYVIRDDPRPAVTSSYGSYARTRLLEKANQRHATPEVLRLGAADRRSLLTRGKPVLKKKPQRRYSWRR